MGDWLLQSWNTTPLSSPPNLRVIHFFPGIDAVIPLAGSPYEAAPARAATASFWRLAAAGGVLASGRRALVSRNSSHYVTRAEWVGVEAPPGGGTFVVRTDLARPLASSPPGASFTELGSKEGLVQVVLPPGGSVALFSAAAPPGDFSVAPAAGCPTEFNAWGRSPVGQGGVPVGTPVVLRNCSYGADGRAAPTQRYAFNASTGAFALQDGSGRCLSVASCAGENGALVQLVPCAIGGGGGGESPIGCERQDCGPAAVAWDTTGPTGTPPNAIKTRTSGNCIDVNGALNPTVIDVWECGAVPGAYRNEEFVWEPQSGAILSLDTAPACACYNM